MTGFDVLLIIIIALLLIVPNIKDEIINVLKNLINSLNNNNKHALDPILREAKNTFKAEKSIGKEQSINFIYQGTKYSVERIQYYGNFYFLINATLNLKHDMLITAETPASKLAKNFGLDDYTTGDIEFDDKFNLKAKHSQEFFLILNKETRKSMLYLFDHAYKFSIQKNIIHNNFKLQIPIEKMSIYSDFESIFYTMAQIIASVKILKDCREFETTLMDNILNEADDNVRIKMIKTLVTYCNTSHSYVKKGFSKILHSTVDVHAKILTARYAKSKGESFLLKQLKSDDDAIVFESIQALRYCGSLKSIKPLINVKSKHNKHAIIKAIEATIETIHEREGSSNMYGSMAILEHDEKNGGLSNIGEKDGMVSFCDKYSGKDN